jgi:hypothetical protein
MRRARTAAIICALIAQTTNAIAAEKQTRLDIVIGPIPERAEIRDALIGAISLLPRAPSRIVVMDVTTAKPGVRERLLTLDAFILKGHAEIYVVQQSEVLKRARTGTRVYHAMLAAVVWHEMAHLAGSDEQEARRAEEALWTSFVRNEVVDGLTGLRYLQALRKRPADHTLPAEVTEGLADRDDRP